MNTLRAHALILGSGPAGMFAADALLQAGVTDIVLLERGRSMPKRTCPPGPACDCRTCDVLEGEGGAGSFSDGKITLSAVRGTHAQQLFTDDQAALLTHVEATVRQHVSVGIDYAPVPTLSALVGQPGLRGESYPLLHVGSDGVREFGDRFCADLQRRGLRMMMGWEATGLIVEQSIVRGALARDRHGEVIPVEADAVIAAVGMVGTPWLEHQLRAAGVDLATGPADLGIRLETSAAALDPLISEFYDFKALHTSADGISVRSFCVNGHGFIVNEYHRPLGIRGVNGHSFLRQGSNLSNLAILATIDTGFTADPKHYVRTLAGQINAAGDGYPIRQTLREFMPDTANVRPLGVVASNPKTRPGNLRAALPAPLADAFTSYITALGAALPPVLAPDTVLYAPEIKYYNYRVPIDPRTWESLDLPGLYVVGNAAGYTASLSAAALSGLIAGQAIADRVTRSAAR